MGIVKRVYFESFSMVDGSSGSAGSVTSTKEQQFPKLRLSDLRRQPVHQNHFVSDCPRHLIRVAVSAGELQPEIAAVLKGWALCCLAKLCGKI